MTNTVSARDRVHIKYCKDGRCMIEHENAGDACRNLDHLLDVVTEQALHHATTQILDLHMDVVLRHSVEVGQGLVLAAKEIDPYQLQNDGTLVRKVDGSPVTVA